MFGQREIPTQPEWLTGYRGELRFPVTAGRFTLPNGTNISIPCTNFPNLPSSLVFQTDTCAYPLQNQDTTGTNAKCVLPCPFPVIPLSDLQVIGWAFIVPGLIGMVFSVFVCIDTLWVLFEATNGFGCYDRARTLWAKQSTASRHDGSSADQVISAGQESSSTSSRLKRSKVRSSYVYALLGSILGIIYFFIGPLMTLLNFEKISCAGNAVFDVSELSSGTQAMGNSMCNAQRVAPFVLQGIFNLMLYALFRVMIMVDQRFKRWTVNAVNRVRFIAVAYCGLGPFVTMGIALGIDKTTDDITLLFGQLARNSAICTMRLSTAQEIVLVFVPFIITGCLITALSFYIWSRLSSIQAGVKNLQADKHRTSDRALRLLTLRLSILGLATFIVIIILMASTGYVIQAMATFSPRFNAWFACETTTGACANSQDCSVLKTDAYAVSPTFNAFAVQIAAMSCISLLLSGFFAAQAAPRLFHEWYTGELSQKLDNILEGRPLHYHIGSGAGGSSANAEAVKSSPAMDIGNKRVAPGKGQTDNSVAAYMMSEGPSPVFEHEMSHTREKSNNSKRVEGDSGN